MQGTSADNAKAMASWFADGTTWNAADVASADRLGFAGPPAVGSQGMVALVAKAGTLAGDESYYRSTDGQSWKPMGAGILGSVTGTDGSVVPAAKYVGDEHQILAYGQLQGNTNAAVEYYMAYVSENGDFGNLLAVSGTDAANVTGSDTVGNYVPVLLRDGILFVRGDGSALFGQAAGH